MSATITKKLLTAEEFAKLPDPIDGSKQELVRGEIVRQPAPSFTHGLVKGSISFALQTYAKDTRSGRVTLTTGVSTELSPDTVRGPDVLFWSYKRLPADCIPESYAVIPPDLCVEVRSITYNQQKLTLKIREYLACGVRMAWVVDPEDRTVVVYRQAGSGLVLWDDETIECEDVLPGFRYPVAEFFK
jgi:Uma2 family endonuclease